MKFFVFNVRQVLFGAAACLLLCSLLICGFSVGRRDRETVAETRRIPVYKVEKEEKVASLTFDAAWGNEDTQTLIDILGRYHVRATFFVVGDWAEKYPESVKALSDAGHEVMNHSDTHPDMTRLSVSDIKAEVAACNDKVSAVTGKTPTLFRAPYGSYNNQLIDTLDELGMTCVQWDVDSLDWKDPSVDQLVKNVVSKVTPGSICLFHNAAKNTPAALPRILDSLTKDGYTFVPVSELLLREESYVDHAGCQRPKNRPTGQTDPDTEETLAYDVQPYYGDYYMDSRYSD